MPGNGGKDVAALEFGGGPFRLVSHAGQLLMEEVAHRALIAGDGLDIHELTREGDNIHAQEDTSNADVGVPARASLLLCLSPSRQ